jgi:hypothetical protein
VARVPKQLVVLGIMGRTPLAGVAWQALHYLEGFRRLGYDVWYVEDTGDWPYDPVQNTVTGDCRYAVEFIARMLGWCGLPGRWAYRAGSENGRLYGLAEPDLAALWQSASVLINLTGSTRLGGPQLGVPVRVYLETDPVAPQIQVAQGNQSTIDLLAAHTHHFTYGENFGAPDCRVPVVRFAYRPTRPPVILEWWAAAAAPAATSRFTTIANWKQTGKDIEWQGERYSWSKHEEFLKFLDLPRRTRQPLELALTTDDRAAVQLLESHGWRVRNALAISRDLRPYQDYIRQARGEFTVAKDQNVRLRSGWFSDRSACFLAAGRPVVTQDTGFGHALPTGRGLFAFRTRDEAAAALEAIGADYAGHAQAARRLAAEYFASERVLGELLQQCT